MLMGIKLLGIIIGAYYLYKSYDLIVNKKEDVRLLILWVVAGIALISVSINPNIVYYLSGLLGMSYRGNMIFAVGILLTYILILTVFDYNRKLNREISKLNEEIAMLRYEIEKKVK